MQNLRIDPFDRRQFALKILPACSLTCLLGGGALEAAPSLVALEDEEKHKFDGELAKKLSYRQLFALQYREYIELTKALSAEMGKEKLIVLLKKFTREKMLKYGQSQAKGAPDRSFSTYVNTFKSPSYNDTLTLSIVEDTEKVFEIKVTECLWATTFLQAGEGDIGFASVCFGDYAWAEGFNPKIEMVRDKTLMEGHGFCNHRYLWKG
jgi:hypothetical protein